jgi:5-formyltetrahydrofolate cyclo-ligase
MRQRAQFSEQLLAQAQQVSDFQVGQKIALYLANDGEIDPKHIKNFLKNKGIIIYLPKIDDKSLKFAKLSDKLKKNKFDIDEPITTDLLNAEQLDIIFMPLVGFNAQKNRIGMGGGFYDRTLAFKKQPTKTIHPKLIGLAFDCQKTDEITTKEWDIPLDIIITPTTIYR